MDDADFFLGGHDLEMVAVRELLDAHAPGRVHDAGLGWGARASDYATELGQALATGRTAVLIELADDLGLTSGPHAGRVTVIDHHGARAGADVPTSLEQVFALLGRPSSEWTRWHALVAANDRGHIDALLRAGATPDEVRTVRAADRAAQGVTADEEESGRRAAAAAELALGGRLTVVRLPHGRTATVTDALHPALGGAGYRNLLVLSPGGATFFGDGAAVAALSDAFPGGFFGGELPARGFWGYPAELSLDQLLSALARSLP